MPGLFSDFQLKDVRLRNRIAISPMTQYSCGTDGIMNDWHLVHLGARAAGGAGLVVMEQLAVSPEGRMTPNCAGIWSDEQIPMLRRIADFIRSTGAVPGVQLGHSGRKGGITPPWDGYAQLPEDHPDGWESIGPSTIPYGGARFPRAARAADLQDIERLKGDFARGAERALRAGFEWVELHYAHGFLGANFLSPMANDRTDAYGNSSENRARFLHETLEAVRAVWPERLPLTARIGAFDYHEDSHTIEESIELVRGMAARGLDLIDISMGMNSDSGKAVPWTERGFMVPAATRIRQETALPVAVSWNLADPAYADALIREDQVDLVMLGRPTIANPHWPLYAALVLGQDAPYDMLPIQYGHALKRTRDEVNCGGFGPIPARQASR
ncbi:NADH:flavin oxidoreductase/NADH oxidase [Robbsia sp. Bb-Pol-6]|uniref:NADH:flavin oxidoreductase/NADH oxidase n=1 Tax=Robbsia betulipollinis TaxID=2981849 RepID=A0ABT3ZJ91_9BURK|nr:NADH:flavin oxidoreductase/NADH oxidase [Robbsia betulipollinis]MCY0386058.1 NADH:flavin oxidoreductase/NADH oxidase [Robbsia betulipollinis]